MILRGEVALGAVFEGVAGHGGEPGSAGVAVGGVCVSGLLSSYVVEHGEFVASDYGVFSGVVVGPLFRGFPVGGGFLVYGVEQVLEPCVVFGWGGALCEECGQPGPGVGHVWWMCFSVFKFFPCRSVI